MSSEYEYEKEFIESIAKSSYKALQTHFDLDSFSFSTRYTQHISQDLVGSIVGDTFYWMCCILALGTSKPCILYVN